MTISRRRRLLVSLLLIITLILTSTIMIAPGASADAELDANLAEAFAPELLFNSAERCFPVTVDYYLDSCSLYQVVDDHAFLVTDSPTVAQLAVLTDDDHFLRNRNGGVDDDGVIDAYDENRTSLGYTVYYDVQQKGGMIHIQYWIFYVFNPGPLNRHQGDWEMIQVVLDSDLTPVATVYSEHHEPIRASWDSVLKSDGHPVAYVALGSHANYYRYYQGKLQGMDTSGGDGVVLDHQDYELVRLNASALPGEDTSWLWFGGRWGDIPDLTAEVRGEAGPPGPMHREDGKMWDAIVFYQTASDLNTGWLWVEWLLYHLDLIIYAIVAVSAALTALRLLRQHREGTLKTPYLEILNIHGPDRCSLGNLLALVGLLVAVVALNDFVFHMEAWIIEGAYATDGYSTLLQFGGTNLLIINTFRPDGQLTNVGSIAMNFALILYASVVLFIMANLANSARKVSKRYIRYGIALTLLVSLMIVAVVLMAIYYPDST